MKRLWLLLIPAFALPDLLFSQQTSVGILKSTDWFIGPYLLLLAFAGAATAGKRETKSLTTLLWFFSAWALVSTLTLGLRYGYGSDYFVRFGLVKVGKFALYAAAGVGTVRAVLADRKVLPHFHWAVLLSLLIAAVSAYVTQAAMIDLPSSPEEAGFRFEAMNAVSVQISILMAFVVGEWVAERGTTSWRTVGVILLPVAVLGFFLTGGRGGWIGLIVALGYVLLKVGLRPSFVVAGFVVVLVGSLVYSQNESFSHHVDITVNPELLDQTTEFAQTTGFDDGNRFDIFVKESQKLFRSPLFGAGMFHRGARSGLDANGSHNFFLQMFLETGFVGGAVVLLFFRRMWLIAGPAPAGGSLALGTRAALVAAIVGGCTGEYYYGGPVLFTLFAVLTPAYVKGHATARSAASATVAALPAATVAR